MDTVSSKVFEEWSKIEEDNFIVVYAPRHKHRLLLTHTPSLISLLVRASVKHVLYFWMRSWNTFVYETGGASVNGSCAFEMGHAPVKQTVNLWNGPCTYWCETSTYETHCAPVKRVVHVWNGKYTCETGREIVKRGIHVWDWLCMSETSYAPLETGVAPVKQVTHFWNWSYTCEKGCIPVKLAMLLWNGLLCC